MHTERRYAVPKQNARVAFRSVVCWWAVVCCLVAILAQGCSHRHSAVQFFSGKPASWQVGAMASTGVPPTFVERAAITDLATAATWARLQGVVATETTPLGALCTALGGVPSPGDLADIPPETYLKALEAARIAVASGPGVKFTPLQIAACVRLRGACRLLVGLTYQEEPPPGGAGTPGASTAKKVKLSSIVDVAAEAEVDLLDTKEVLTMFEAYKATRGDYPPPDAEPSTEQISAVQQLIKNGATPYVDFSLFGPHAKRFLKKLQFIAFSYNPHTGEWSRSELAGPPDFEHWWRSWIVFKTTLLLLNAVDTEILDLYGEHVRRLNENYGREAWFLVYQADIRMRSEEFERIRRRLAAGLAPTGLSAMAPARPWNSVFHASVHTGDIQSVTFWAREVSEKAVLFLARLRPTPTLVGDGTVLDNRGQSSSSGHTQPSSASAPGKGRKSNKRKAGRDAPPPPPPRGGVRPQRASAGGAPDRNAEICHNYNEGKCQNQAVCHRRHVCWTCSGNHPAYQCKEGDKSNKPASPPKGRGKGSKSK